VSQQVLHLDFIKLTPGTETEQRTQLIEAASLLRQIDGVERLGVLEGEAGSDFDLAFWFVLQEFTALEPFGTHPSYTQFLQGTVAPLITGFAGADVRLDEDFEACDGVAACLALTGPEEAYDFEVRDALSGWSEVAGASQRVIGLAVGEKQLYRGAAIAFGASRSASRPDSEPFRATLIRGRARSLA
jgi:hypothetical protein